MFKRLATFALYACLSIATLAIQPATAAVLQPRWPAGTYSYLVPDQDVRVVLKDFERQMRLPIVLSDRVRGRLSGRLPAAGPREFLDELCSTQGLVWFYDGAAIHVAALDENKTELISLPEAAPDDAQGRFDGFGLTDPRFQLRLSRDRRLVSVSGPPAYVARVKQVIASLATEAPRNAEASSALLDDPRVRVFRGGRAAR